MGWLICSDSYISNFDGLITQLCENPDLVGNNTANACFAVVNGEVVTGIDPRTIPADATYTEQEHSDVLSRARSNGLTYSQVITDSYGKNWSARRNFWYGCLFGKWIF